MAAVPRLQYRCDMKRVRLLGFAIGLVFSQPAAAVEEPPQAPPRPAKKTQGTEAAPVAKAPISRETRVSIRRRP